MDTVAHMESRAPVRVVVVNDYEMVVRGLAALLAPYAERVVVVELAVNMPADRRADLALYDTFGARQGEDLDVTTVLERARADRLVVYSWSDDAELARAALEAGASGFVPKKVSGEALVSALERIRDGELLVATAEEAASQEPGDWPGRATGLSEREAEMIALICQGMTNNQIAGRAALSPNTVAAYVRSAYRKIGVNSRSTAILWGLAHGFTKDRVRVRWPNEPDEPGD
jgi:NarL family two-component system response regulator LiaR